MDLKNEDDVKFPEKSLIELAYSLYLNVRDTPFIKDTKLKEINTKKLSNNWLKRLLDSRLLLRYKKKNICLTYPPNLYFDVAYTRDQAEFNYKWIKKIFPNATVITSRDISTLTFEGYVSVELDVVLNNAVLVDRLQHTLKKHNIYFWETPTSKATKKVLIAYTQFVKADPRTLSNMIQIYNQMNTREQTMLIKSVCSSRAPVSVVDYVLRGLGIHDFKINPRFHHPTYSDEWKLATLHGGYSITQKCQTI